MATAVSNILIKVDVDLKELSKLEAASKRFFGANVKKYQEINNIYYTYSNP